MTVACVAIVLSAEDFLATYILLYSVLILGASFPHENATRILMGITLNLGSRKSNIACS